MSQLREDRLASFFPDGKTVIVPIDHGHAIPVPGMEDPGGLIEALNPFADGYVVCLGMGLAFADQLEGKAVCLRTDFYKPDSKAGAFGVYGAEEALQMGASAMMNMCFPNHENEENIIRDCARVISDGMDAELPVIVEALPYGLGRSQDYTVEHIGFAVRMAAELGADVVKTSFPTDASVDEFKAIVDACFVPVVVLGGAAMGDDEALLTMVSNAMQAGAAGIAVGRNVWQHPEPPKIAKALQAVVHEGAAVEQAMKNF